MVYKYDNAREAVAFVVGCLSEQFPDAHAELIYFSRNRAQTVTGPLTRASNVLEKMCRRWPRVTVEYTPENKYGMVAELQCHGETNKEHNTVWRRRKDFGRPRVVVMLTKVGGEDLLVGGKESRPGAEGGGFTRQEGVLATPEEEV